MHSEPATGDGYIELFQICGRKRGGGLGDKHHIHGFAL